MTRLREASCEGEHLRSDVFNSPRLRNRFLAVLDAAAMPDGSNKASTRCRAVGSHLLHDCKVRVGGHAHIARQLLDTCARLQNEMHCYYCRVKVRPRRNLPRRRNWKTWFATCGRAAIQTSGGDPRTIRKKIARALRANIQRIHFEIQARPAILRPHLFIPRF
jgi:hypothetical protein